LRERLLGEIAGLNEADPAVSWAKGVIAAKNSLIAADARIVEIAFEHRLAGLSDAAAPDEQARPRAEQIESDAGVAAPRIDLQGDAKAASIDKGALAIAEPRRYRNKEHLRFVATKACVICGRKPSDPHHLRFTQPRALGRKVSDEFVVPLCRTHHRAVHRVGNELNWWKEVGIEPIKVARSLWNETRGTRRTNRLEDVDPGPPESASASEPTDAQGTAEIAS
jgi:hypothetical protein